MKNLFLLLFFLIFTGVTANAQRLYSNENLQQSSDQELEVYLKNAEKQKRNGFIFAAVGGGAMLGTIALASSSGDFYDAIGIALIGTIVGTTFTGIGIGKVLSNSGKIRRINKIKDSRASMITLNLLPDFRYDKTSNNTSAGLKLSIAF